MKHARNSASSAYRWLACPGSIKLSEKCPPPAESEHAIEGTAAHELAERVLKNVYFNGPACNDEYINGVRVDREMIDAVLVYAEAIQKVVSKDALAGGQQVLMVEDKFSLEWLYPGMFGTNDACVYDLSSGHLQIFDYKHGKGLVVEVEWNSQLMFYALGACYSLWTKYGNNRPIEQIISDVTLTVVQPRAEHVNGPVRSWSVGVKDLLFWGMNVLRPGAVETHNDKAPLRSGPHCRFCPALAVCPEQYKVACSIAKTDFDRPVLPSPESLTGQDILKVLEASEIFGKWSKEVIAYAQRKLELGEEVPGYKLVKKKSNRSWLSENAALQTLYQYLKEGAFEYKVLTVAQAEKKLKELNLNPALILEGLWEKPEKGLSIAPESDRRKAVCLTTSQNDFLEYHPFLQ